MEKLPEKKGNLDLTAEQSELFAKAKKALLGNVSTKEDFDSAVKKRSKIVKFGKQLEEKGINPREYILWHAIIGSSLSNDLEFDTSDHDIEKFIKSLE